MSEKPQRRSRRSGLGRQARLEKRKQASGPSAVWPGLEGGRYRPLGENDMNNVHQAALTILEQTGIKDPTPELLDLLLPKGATVNQHGRLCFSKSLMEDVIDMAAKEYYVFARGSLKGKGDIHCKQNDVYFSCSGTAVTTFDVDTRSYRPSILTDMYDFTRLVDSLEHIHMTGDTVLATDYPEDYVHDMNMLYALLAGSEKPTCFCLRSKDFLEPAINMLDIASGSEGAFVKEPTATIGGCPIVSPLRFGKENLELLMETSRLGIISDIAVPPQAGATSPAPLAGTLAQCMAETLSCLAVVNLINPGSPMTFAAWPFVTDLRTGSFTGGSGEQALIGAAAIQMGNYYNLPTSVGAGMTDAKIPDAQYGYEKALTFALAAHAGANRICEFGGMVGSLMGCSFESMVIDNDAAGMILRTLRGIEVSDETLAVDIIHQCAIDPGHFLGNDQTLGYMETEYVYPQLMDRSRTDQWESEGAKDVLQRSQKITRDILNSHFPNYFGETNDQHIRAEYPIKLPKSAMQAK